MKKIFFMVLMVSLTIGLFGCEQNENNNDAFTVVATTTYLGDLARQVGGDVVTVETLMDVGVDPHDYEPTQSDTRRIEDADLLMVNGFNLEERLGNVLESMDDSNVFVASDSVSDDDYLFEDEETLDPHIWFDTDIWSDVTKDFALTLSTILPEYESTFESRADEYVKDLAMLDDYIESRVNELDEHDRVLVTAHDAFAYFGERYGFDVHAVQGISTASEASISAIENLAALLVEYDVNKVFWESSVPQGTVDSLVEAAQDLDHTVSVGGELYSDSTGDTRHGHETYIRTYRANIDTIVDALSES